MAKATKRQLDKPHPNPKKKLVPQFSETPEPKESEGKGKRRKAMYL